MERAQPADNIIVAGLMERLIFWGLIVGHPVGGIYQVVSAGRTTSADAMHARIIQGEPPAAPSSLAPGTFVRAEGTTVGKIFRASRLVIIPLPSRKHRR